MEILSPMKTSRVHEKSEKNHWKNFNSLLWLVSCRMLMSFLQMCLINLCSLFQSQTSFMRASRSCSAMGEILTALSVHQVQKTRRRMNRTCTANSMRFSSSQVKSSFENKEKLCAVTAPKHMKPHKSPVSH